MEEPPGGAGYPYSAPSWGTPPPAPPAAPSPAPPDAPPPARPGDALPPAPPVSPGDALSPLRPPEPPRPDALPFPIEAPPPPRPRRWPWAVAGVVVLVALVAAAVGWYTTDRAADEAGREADDLAIELESAQDVIGELTDRIELLEQAVLDLPDPADVAEATRDSVFTIVTRDSSGSGWVVQVDGDRSLVVTNFHVVETQLDAGSSRVAVQRENFERPGRVVDFDEELDLAIIAVEERFEPLEVSTEEPRVGEPVIVVGSPLGLEQTVVTGVVSALREGFIQFSAPISPGNSGGPVLNARGQVIGVTVLKIVDDAAEGLSFAIPVGDVCAELVSC